MKNYQFLDYFPQHKYRYIDQTGNGRPPVSSSEIRPELNTQGYESYFTVNGFSGVDSKKENCICINSFFIDIDEKISNEQIDKIKARLDPTFIIETFHGFHFYWLLDESIYKDDMTPELWNDTVSQWERIEQQIVTDLNADPVVKDITRILRVPGTYYWKKTGEKYKEGLKGVFQIKGIQKSPANTYTIQAVADAFPVKEQPLNVQSKKLQTYADGERNDFFTKVNELFPMANRDSFKKLISGAEGTLPPDTASRNSALLVTVSLMKQAKWTKEQAFKHIENVGWHGIEKEKGGMQEIMNTINSAFNGGYTFSHKNPIVAFNMDMEEQMMLQNTFTDVLKGRKEKDKVRFSNYENEMLIKHPNLKKNEGGMIFDYVGGVYKPISDVEISGIILRDLYEDMLWGYRTGRNVSDKLKCLLSILPDMELTDDRGTIINLKNGLLNIYTKVLKPHTPAFISLVQSPVSYDPEAICPMWESCVAAWMDGDESDEKTEMLKQFAGYTLSSSMNYDRALFLVGDGGNGKSTFVDTISMVIGDQATSHIDLEDLYGMFGMHALIGKRLNVIEEVHGNYYQSNKLKKLISGEPVTINVKYKEAFFFRPQAKFIFAVNIMPRVDDTSTAMERRICSIVFKNNFRNAPNTALRNNGGLLAQELSGILNWMLEGAISLKEKGTFIVTQEQRNLLKEYREENSSVEGFIAECLVFEEGEVSTTRELYDEYKEYCIKDGRKFKGSIGFTKEMKVYGKRHTKFSYIERTNGKEENRFEGVKAHSGWGRTSNVNVEKYLNS